jgi:amidohydrolase
MPPLAEDASPQPVPPWLDGFLDAHLDELVAFRRRLHAHPEVSWAEVETTAAVIDRLRVAGLSPSQLPESTGLVCDLATGTASSFEAPSDGRPVVALRADLDALAMEDEKDVAYRSTLPGVAHACGHDVHTTVVLGAALALAEAVKEGELTGAFRFIFEPAEEALPGGAPSVIDAGALGGVSSMLGVHCDPKIDVGQVALRTGPITSAADMARITILGPGGHTARPELTVNLLAVLGQVLSQVPERMAKAAAPAEVLVVFGSTHGGDAPNVIPTRATATATIRTPDVEAWEHAAELLDQATRAVVEPTGATLEFAYRKGVHPRSTLLPRPAPFAGRRPRWWGNTTPSRLNTAAVATVSPGMRARCPPRMPAWARSTRPPERPAPTSTPAPSTSTSGRLESGFDCWWGPHWPSATAWHPAESS